VLATRLSDRPEVLQRLFDMLGLVWTGHLPTDAQTLKDALFAEHGSLATEYADEVLLATLPLGEELGLVGQTIDLPQQMIIGRINNPGGTKNAMVKRFRLDRSLPSRGYRVKEMVTWAGQRLRDLDRSEKLTDMIRLLMERPDLLSDPWVRQELRKCTTVPNLLELLEAQGPDVLDSELNQQLIGLLDEDDRHDRYNRPFAIETDVCILCAKVEYGDQMWFKDAKPVTEQSLVPDVPAREVLYYRFGRLGRADLIIFNARATERTGAKGVRLDPRPTSVTSALEVMAEFGMNGLQGLMGSKPHTLRIAKDIDAALTAAGATPEFVIIGLPTPEATTLEGRLRIAKTMVGEVVRTLILEAGIS
jgi:hypothetical protein